MKIKILAEAEQDLLDGIIFYDEQSPGVGGYFLASLEADIDSLQVCAGVHEKQHGFHLKKSRRFPYAIYYRFENKTIEVHAVLDCRRSPDWIRDRLIK